MGYKKILVVLLVNFAIACGFFIDHLDANVTDISSDLANIIPICKKLDNPQLYKNDMYLNDINDVKYYTPFYVESLRAMAVLSSGDYFQALNLLGFAIHLIYGIIWFAFFYTLRKDFWLALIFSIFFRGILWPPGGELLGISSLWTAMPRTLFIALAPLPFLAYTYLPRYKIAISAFILGLILNFHPISGVGMIVCYFSVFIFHDYFTRGFSKVFLRELGIAVLFCMIGILPYLVTYMSNIKVADPVDHQLFKLAFEQRLGHTFSDPLIFISQWNRPILWLLAASFAAFYFFDSSLRKLEFRILFCTILVVFISANGVVYLEQAVNQLFDKNIRMSFQLIRYQKFLLVLLQIGLFFLMVNLAYRFAIKENIKKVLLIVFLLLLSVSTFPVFSKVPLVGDDLMTSILPESLKFYKKEEAVNKRDMGKMTAFIKENTAPDAVFYGTFMIRAGSNRSVILDYKAAGMLIEGNSDKFIAWYHGVKKLESSSEQEKLAFLRSQNVNYIMSDSSWNTMIPIKNIGKFYLYKI